jgi:hypothetical protein
LGHVTLAASLVLACLLGFSGLKKGMALAVFSEQLADYRLVPYRITRVAAVALISAELSAALLLLIPSTRQEGAMLAATLLATFVLAMVISLARGRRIACGCFGASSDLDIVGAASVVRAVLLFVLAGVASVPTASSPVGPVTTVMLAAIFGAVVFLGSEFARLLQMIPESSRLVRLGLDEESLTSA